jgi:hypothetical protein
MTKHEATEIVVNGVRYVPADSVGGMAQPVDGMPYVMCRTYSAGVFAGFLKSRNGKEVVLLNARRIWRWAGAASLSELSQHGTNAPGECKFPCEVLEVTLTEVIELLPVSAKAKASIDGVPVWTA